MSPARQVFSKSFTATGNRFPSASSLAVPGWRKLGVAAAALMVLSGPALACPSHGSGGAGMGWHHGCGMAPMPHRHGEEGMASKDKAARAPGVIQVTGSGEASVAPDLAIITLGVTVQAPTAAEAMAQNAARQQGVIDALKARGIESRDIQTSGLNLSPVQDFSREGQPPRITGYQAGNMVTVRVRDLPELGPVLDAIVTAGANEVQGIGFQRDDASETEAEARRRAVDNARERAEVIATAAGQRLGRLVQLTDGGSSAPSPQPLGMRAMAADAAFKTPVETGELNVSAQVTATWELLPEDDDRGMRRDRDGRRKGDRMERDRVDHDRMDGKHDEDHGDKRRGKDDMRADPMRDAPPAAAPQPQPLTVSPDASSAAAAADAAAQNAAPVVVPAPEVAPSPPVTPVPGASGTQNGASVAPAPLTAPASDAGAAAQTTSPAPTDGASGAQPSVTPPAN